MEDLRAGDFAMIDLRTEKLTADHVNLVMSALGKMHALSFAIQDQQPEKFKEITSNLGETLIRRECNYLNGCMANSRKVLDTVRTIEGKRIAEKIKALYSNNFLKSMIEMVDSTQAEPYAVISHGDCWSNNTMFRLDAQRNPIEVQLLDFQIARYASPALEIVYYIFFCTDKQLRDQYYDSFLKVYHSSLSAHLERYVDSKTFFAFFFVSSIFIKFLVLF